MIRQLPHGGMSTGDHRRVMARDELAEVRGELWQAYRDRIWARRAGAGQSMMSAQPAPAGYGRHIRFEHGTVREMPRRGRRVPQAPDAKEIETMFLEAMFAVARLSSRSTGSGSGFDD